MSDEQKLPEGADTLHIERANGAPLRDVHLALDLARHGASPMLIRAVGGDEAVREAAAQSLRSGH